MSARTLRQTNEDFTKSGGAYAKRYENTCRYIHLLNEITMTTLHGESRSYTRCPALSAGARPEAGTSSRTRQQFACLQREESEANWLTSALPTLRPRPAEAVAGQPAHPSSPLCSTQPAPFSRGLKRGCQASSPNTELLPRYT